MRPNGAAVQELTLGELLDIRAGGVVIELSVLITALILQEDECAAWSICGRNARGAGRTDGVRVEGELLAES